MKSDKNKTDTPLPKMNLLKRQAYWEIVSVWEINGRFIEVTQTSEGKYLLYNISKEELEVWDKYSHFTGGLSGKCTNVGDECEIFRGEWGEHCEK